MTMTPARMLLLVVLLTVASGGCSDSGDRTAVTGSSAASDPVPAAAVASSGVISPADLPVPPAFGNKAQGVISDLDVRRCDTEPGTVRARGTATNSGRFARDVVVTVSWTVGAVGDVVARGVAVVEDLEPGASRDWSVRATVPGDDVAACVPSALAGQVEG